MKKFGKILIILTILFSMGIFASCDKVEFKINFESNGGTAVASISTLGNEVIKMPADPTREGYTFGG